MGCSDRSHHRRPGRLVGGWAAIAAIGTTVILPSDRRTIGLLGELGLEGTDRLAAPVRTGLYAADGSSPTPPSAVAFLRRAPLRAGDKARLAATVSAALAHRDGRRLEQVGVEAWLRRWSGGRAYDVLGAVAAGEAGRRRRGRRRRSGAAAAAAVGAAQRSRRAAGGSTLAGG
ncbi:MAG: hypothetical protein R2749_14590 [Acidimicrobiales bacterium]